MVYWDQGVNSTAVLSYQSLMAVEYNQALMETRVANLLEHLSVSKTNT